MRTALFALLTLCGAGAARAANLDVSASYRMRAVSYSNLGLNLDRDKNSHSFIGNDARLGVAVRKIYLETRGAEETTMDVGLLLRALGATGSTYGTRGSSVTTAASPFDKIADHYPATDFTPFIENAYLRVNNAFGEPVIATFGRQTFRLGSGLLLDDDGAGLTGATAGGTLPWWGVRAQGFVFHDKNTRFGGPSSLMLYGLSVELPSEGTWQLSQLFERDKTSQPVFGCSYDVLGQAAPCTVSKAVRSFTSLRYNASLGAVIVEAEAAMQRGAATPTGRTPSPTHVLYKGDAQLVRAKWKQRLYKTGEGIARVSMARGSGDKPGTRTTDEAFFPSRGHSYNGLERGGMGEFFGANGYEAFGGNYSTRTASGLKDGASGIVAVGVGYTPPAYKGWVLDIDYFLFHADRVTSGPSNLGMEWDLKLRYNIQDHFSVAFIVGLFKPGTASDPSQGKAKKLGFEAYGRF